MRQLMNLFEEIKNRRNSTTKKFVYDEGDVQFINDTAQNNIEESTRTSGEIEQFLKNTKIKNPSTGKMVSVGYAIKDDSEAVPHGTEVAAYRMYKEFVKQQHSKRDIDNVKSTKAKTALKFDKLNSRTKNSILIKTQKKLNNKLSAGLKGVLRIYLDESGGMNARLRHDAVSPTMPAWKGEFGMSDRKLIDFVHAMDNIFAQPEAILDKNIVSYRGVSKKYANKFIRKGTFIDKGFVSTSVSSNVATNFGDHTSIIKFLLPKNTRGVYMNAVVSDTDYSSEQELLLPRNMRFKVIDSYVDNIEEFNTAERTTVIVVTPV